MFFSHLSKQIFKYQLIILVGIFVALSGLLIYDGFYQWGLDISNQGLAPIDQQSPNKQLVTGRSALNGEIVEVGEENLWPVAVSIDNHPEARPTFGLGQAALVYELPVEGGATRLLAFYAPGKTATTTAEKIGPVRSVRPYFLPIAKEYNALLAHSGGSSAALAEIEKLQINNLEEIAWWGPDYFWRVYSRSAPHNLFTSTEKLSQAIIDWKLSEQKPSYQPWLFNDDLNNNFKINPANKINLLFSADKNYLVDWQYSTTTGQYARRQASEKYHDALTNKEIWADDVIIQFVPTAEVLDDVGRLAITMTGTGPLWLFRDGAKIEGYWKKEGVAGRTIFYDAAGNELALKPGKIWIEVVPGEGQITVE